MIDSGYPFDCLRTTIILYHNNFDLNVKHNLTTKLKYSFDTCLPKPRQLNHKKIIFILTIPLEPAIIQSQLPVVFSKCQQQDGVWQIFFDFKIERDARQTSIQCFLVLTLTQVNNTSVYF